MPLLLGSLLTIGGLLSMTQYRKKNQVQVSWMSGGHIVNIPISSLGWCNSDKAKFSNLKQKIRQAGNLQDTEELHLLKVSDPASQQDTNLADDGILTPDNFRQWLKPKCGHFGRPEKVALNAVRSPGVAGAAARDVYHGPAWKLWKFLTRCFMDGDRVDKQKVGIVVFLAVYGLLTSVLLVVLGQPHMALAGLWSVDALCMAIGLMLPP